MYLGLIISVYIFFPILKKIGFFFLHAQTISAVETTNPYASLTLMTNPSSPRFRIAI